MPNKSQNLRFPRAPERLAKKVIQITTKGNPHSGNSEKNPAAVALGRLGGLKGGKARAAKLTAKERSEIAKKAAIARWSKK